MRSPAPTDRLYRPQQRGSLGNRARLVVGLACFALACMAASFTIAAGLAFVARRRRQRFARMVISRMFRAYFQAMEAMGCLQLDLGALDSLRDAAPMVIAPNHPSMIDAGLLLSRLPDLACIMKTEILDSILFGTGARSAGYIASQPPRAMLRGAVQSLESGCHVLLFPEGTRTHTPPVNALQRTVGLIARQARVPVQTVLIECNTGFLGKGWALSRLPVMPMVYQVRLGRRFEAPGDAQAFAGQLQEYFQAELASATAGEREPADTRQTGTQ
ncbi:MAG: 1-acyl-sn-glycerol-3-phosphate acyltransferase [Haliea sp.]|nr:MAG: 1-acyl-sn-glycerol-3-phosphate acyltransferase [Haliea sp.]